MPLEDLLAKVKDEKREEELALKREHKTALENLDSEKRAELESIKDELQKEFGEEKESLLTKKERQKSFELKMERLDLKKELLEKAKEEALKKLEDLSVEEKKDIYLANLKEEKQLLEEAEEILIPKGKKNNLAPILKEAGVDQKPQEKDLDFSEGFLVKGGRWRLEITLEEILERQISRDKKKFVNLLFGDL
ncbi:MAG: hypothetical protein ACQEP3_01880 [Patescibacteria group bacterium]